MNISGSDLLNEWARASKQWQVIAQVNALYGLPPYLLHAVGSRETNLTNEVGDGGHGHGIFQLDDRSHTIPAGFDDDVNAQTEMAAAMLTALFLKYRDWISALNAYNSGSPNSANTTGGDYGPDVMGRQQFLLQQLGAPMTSGIWDTQIVDHYRDGSPGDGGTLSASELLSWAATHAAHSKDEVERLRADLPSIVAAAIAGAVVRIEIVTPQQKTLAPQ
jgi:hypothetical protein